MNKYILKLSSHINFEPTTIVALTKGDAVQQLMEQYDNDTLVVEDESFDLDTLSEETVRTNGYTPMSSVAQESSEVSDDDGDDDFDSDIRQEYVPMSAINNSPVQAPVHEQLNELLTLLSDLVAGYRNTLR
jgi:hypothetical protein